MRLATPPDALVLAAQGSVQISVTQLAASVAGYTTYQVAVSFDT